MNFFKELFDNNAIIVPVIAWLSAQLIKMAIVMIKEKKIDFERLLGSGGMPSSHSAFVVSLAAVIGKNEGWNSPAFAICFAIAMVVMYDAAGVRRAAGKQAQVLNRLIFTHELDNLHFDEKLKELLGHTPFEVLIGALFGIAAGLLLG